MASQANVLPSTPVLFWESCPGKSPKSEMPADLLLEDVHVTGVKAWHLLEATTS